MIGYIHGRILEISDDGKFLISVGSLDSSIGYLVSTPQGTSYQHYLVQQMIELFIYTHIREDQFDLYGFLTAGEKTVFMSLLSVSGIGPKSAMTILAKVGVDILIQAILQGNSHLLQGIPGIGKKTSEKIVVELKDSVKKKIESGQWNHLHYGNSKNSSEKMKKNKEDLKNASSQVLNSSVENSARVFQDAKEALLGLGYREQGIYSILHRLSEELDSMPNRAEDLVKLALKELR